MKPKGQPAYAVRDATGYFFLDTVEATRAAAVWEFRKGAPEYGWDHWYRRGFRCVRVTVQEAR